jgi:hypothetical protein
MKIEIENNDVLTLAGLNLAPSTDPKIKGRILSVDYSINVGNNLAVIVEAQSLTNKKTMTAAASLTFEEFKKMYGKKYRIYFAQGFVDKK